MSGSHSHGHSHGQSPCGHSHGGHSHGGSGALGRLGFAFFLNLTFAIVELIGGYLTNSVAIMSDALHDFGDAFAIGLAFFLEKKSHQSSDQRYSYGYRRFSTASAVITGVILMVGSLLILMKAVPRLWSPEAPDSNGMIGLAILGLAVNGFALWRVSKGTSLSERMILWHLLEDVLGWVVVLIGAILIKIFGWIQLDAILACGLAAWIFYNVFRNLREVLKVFLQVVPDDLNLEEIKTQIRAVGGVRDIHHLHVWSLDGERHILTAHLVVKPGLSVGEIEGIKKAVKELLLQNRVIEATLEIEPEGVLCIDPTHA